MENKLTFSNSGTYKIDSNSSYVLVNEGCDVTLDLECEEENIDVNFDIKDNAKVTLRILNSSNEKTLNLNQKVSKNALFFGILADFSKENCRLKSVSELDGEGASATFNFSTLNKGKTVKDYDISFNHNVKKTYSKLDGYGVCEEESSLVVNGVSHIKEGSIKSKTSQKIKAILFDKTSKAKANPILKIDCDDIEASHACAIGNLNENHIFYLLTRGISLENARKLITMGYLNPIKDYFDEKEQNKISKLIEGNI